METVKTVSAHTHFTLRFLLAAEVVTSRTPAAMPPCHNGLSPLWNCKPKSILPSMGYLGGLTNCFITETEQLPTLSP